MAYDAKKAAEELLNNLNLIALSEGLGLEPVAAALTAARRAGREEMRADLLAVMVEMHARNRGEAPTAAQNERRRHARKLKRIIRALPLDPKETSIDS